MKKHIGNNAVIPVMPLGIIATESGGRLNFAPHGQIGTVAPPNVIYTSVIKEHLTARNILETGRFSVNVPTPALVDKLRFCGSNSGNDIDKSSAFEVFRGEGGFPMIEGCPLSYVCKVVQTIEMNGFYIFLAEVEECYADEDCILEGGAFDVGAINPVLCGVDGRLRIPGKIIN